MSHCVESSLVIATRMASYTRVENDVGNNIGVNMQKFGMLTSALAIGGALVALAQSAYAMPMPAQLGGSAAAMSAVEKTQFIFGGQNYCFYPNGWRGPGWYWCGYAFRPGFGWGGPEGWRGWHRGGPGPGRMGPPPMRGPHGGPPGGGPHGGGPRGPGGPHHH